MNRTAKTTAALAAGLIAIAPLSACNGDDDDVIDDDLEQDVEDSIDDVQDDVEEGIDDVQDEVEDGVSEVEDELNDSNDG